MSKVPKYQRLSRSISLYEAPDCVPGRLIILATWLEAAPKHVAKYTALYEAIAPNAKIMLIQAPMDNHLMPYSIQETNIRPAIDAITNTLSPSTSTSPHILLHIFSNGGANRALQLLQLWKSRTGTPLPLSGLIVDSALATGGAAQNYRGFQHSIPSGVGYRVLGPIAASVALLVLETSTALGRYPRPETAMRKGVLDDGLVRMGGEGGKGSKRVCYFASKADVNTPWQGVVSHADMAQERGWHVDMHLWDDTPHCNHLSRHEDEYVSAVRKMWEGEGERPRAKL